MKRLFIAIKINPQPLLSEMFVDVKNSLKRERITWVDINNMHLTLKFLGETDEDLVKPLINIVEKVTASNAPFEMTLSGLGIFGSRYDPKVIWCGIEKSDSLIKAYKNLNIRLEELGIYPDRQNFVPHLTLGRIKGSVDKDLLSDVVKDYQDTFFQKTNISTISLYESILRPQGPLYIELK